MANPIPDIVVSLVNTNNRKLLEPCLESLFGQSTGKYSMEVWLVDNVSTDGSVDMVRSRFPSVKIIENQSREGFGANHNKILSTTKGRFYLVLNEDTVILDHAVDRLVEFADAHPNAGIVGPKTFNPDMTLQQTCIHFPTITTRLKQMYVTRKSDFSNGAYSDASHDTVQSVEWLRGSCLLVRDEAMQTVGMLDERFFIFYEEVDWCYRMVKAGWQNIHCPDAKIIHVSRQTVSNQPDKQQISAQAAKPSGPRSIAMTAQMNLSELLYFDKHYPGAVANLWRLFYRIWLPMRRFKLKLARGRSPEELDFSRRLLNHLIHLTSLSPSELIAVGRYPGGVVPQSDVKT